MLTSSIIIYLFVFHFMLSNNLKKKAFSIVNNIAFYMFVYKFNKVYSMRINN